MKNYIVNHKIVSLVVALLIVGGYFLFGGSSKIETRYVLAKVEKGTLEVTVSGNGLVAAQNQIELKAKNSGNVTYVGVKAGQEVRAGALIVSLDSRDAKLALQNAQISLEKLTDKPETLDLLQKQHALTEARDALEKSYDDGWSAVASAFIDITSVIDNLDDLYRGGYLGSQNIVISSDRTKDRVGEALKIFYAAKKSLKETAVFYKTVSRENATNDIEDLISKTYATAKVTADALKNAEAALTYAANDMDEETTPEVSEIKTDLAEWTKNINGYVGSLLSAENSITNFKHTLSESTQSLDDLTDGASELDTKEAEIALQQKQNAYDDLFIRAPFSGVIATISAKVGESAGENIATLITRDKIAEIALNEVDIANVKIGEEATLTFDAVPSFNIKGKVVEIDLVGTEDQGVVTYKVKIGFDSKDERIKPGMSVSADIITDAKENVLVVPTSALKSRGEKSYVEVLDEEYLKQQAGASGVIASSLPGQKTIETGLSNDRLTEVLSGLEEGDEIVVRTISNSASQPQTPRAPSFFSAPGGGNRGGSGGMRIQGR